jgi:cytochrome c oxidase subunit 1
MSLTYFLIPVLFRREVMFPGLAKWQPYLFGFGMAVFCLVMMGAGTLGVPRRHWDMSFLGAALPYEFPGSAFLLMSLVGIAGVTAVIGGGAYILITVCSIFLGKKLEEGTYSAKPTPVVTPVTSAVSGHGNVGFAGFAAPGTFVLAMVFLVSFVLYYFINWKYLSQVWFLS